jgi:predicted ArsR family transcriptional regulator
MERLDAIGPPELRAALMYVRRSPHPVTADDAARALGVHRSAARSRLERLLRAGLVEASFSRRSGRSGPGAGRPAKHYAAAPESEALELPPRYLPALVSRLLDEIPSDGREDALRRAGEDFGRELADAAGLEAHPHIEAGAEAVCATVRSLGFQAAVDRIEDHTVAIVTPTCPLRPLVMERVEVAYVDRGMWAGLMERGCEGVHAQDVECESHSCLDGDGPCSVVIRLTAGARSSSP